MHTLPAAHPPAPCQHTWLQGLSLKSTRAFLRHVGHSRPFLRAPGVGDAAPRHPTNERSLINVAEIRMSNGSDYPTLQGSWDTWRVMHFSVSIKIKVEVRVNQDVLLLCRLAGRFLARIEMSLCDLVSRGRMLPHHTPASLYPHPHPPRGSMQILDQVPEDHVEPI